MIARGAEVTLAPSRDGGAVAIAALRPGDATAGFRRVGDRWLADDLWCAPPPLRPRR